MDKKYYIGIDVGSTTIKIYITDQNDECIFSKYERHYSDIQATIKSLLQEVKDKFGNLKFVAVMTGSGGLALAECLEIKFVQEVIACTKTVETYIPECDVAIELGGEDAKITYFKGSLEQRMNGSCAGGTGAFIDQMASLLQTDAAGLNELAKNYQTIYPIASRCGVFAKTDIQPLINDGANKEDLAISIFQAVVNQTISGLACGKPIRGKVAFLGGPLYFLDQLRQRFIDTLKLTDEEIIFPDNSQLFVAMGATLLAKEESQETDLDTLLHRLNNIDESKLSNGNTLEPLFKNEEDRNEFRHRHYRDKVRKNDLRSYIGNAYLGLDVGSTTTKAVLIDENDAILYSFYDSNEGNPLGVVEKIIREIYDILPSGVKLAYSGVTGYGEALVKAAMKIDMGEVETMAHYKAATYFKEDVSFILDIGGQDMKAIKIKDGIIQDILLNEACSSGCGSFIETFAKSLGYNVSDFAALALESKAPIDLGSRCTVFMNSKVKQAQKEGAKIEDISAGLSYSVIKNALYKVIKLRSKEELGKSILVQGGTFYNESVLRAFEKEAGVNAIRPDIAGLMGAFGIARLARENYHGQPSTLLTKEQLDAFTCESEIRYCQKCTNHCMLTVSTFNDKSEYISGNRCERGANLPLKSKKLPNLFDYKYRRIFNYRSLTKDQAKRGTVGIPRVLNMYENYPFWHTLFTKLGFRVVISPRSSKAIYEKGIESIPSESVCYPAKISHGHIEALIEKGIRYIFYPSVAYERQEFDTANNHYNCPVVTSYPEVIRNNVDNLQGNSIIYRNPFIDLSNPKTLLNVLKDEFSAFKISDKELKAAIDAGYEELAKCRQDIQEQGEMVLGYLKENNLTGIVLAGRPYHVDPEINHGIADLITAEGMAVLTEDSICHLDKEVDNLRVVDQWTYHSRLYRAASFVSTQSNLELIQLTSFGCGLDAVTSDQVAEILNARHKIYTLIKIDEGSNLGAIRIRIRSLKATILKQDKINRIVYQKYQPLKVPFTKEMKDSGYTILCPQMSPIHFQFIETAMQESGYNLVVLPSVDKGAVDAGLKYVNNDACYPSILVTGQIMEALLSGKYDLDKTAVIISQTGGGCRATNYIAFIRKALQDARMPQVPVISANLQGLESNPGFKITLPLVKKVIIGAMYGDLFMRVLYRVRPYEATPGSANKLYESWVERCQKNVRNGSISEFRKNVYQIVKEFDNLPILNIKKPRVGLVGEILVKFHPTANNEIVEIVEREGGEAVMPDLIDFFQYCFYSTDFENKHFHASKKSVRLCNLAIKFVDLLRHDMIKALKKSKRFDPPTPIDHIAKKASTIVSIGNQTGEGWFLTGEMIELIESGAPNIVCMQPFACLPNHVTGKGAIKALRKAYPQSNIVAIDYDPGASEVNQLNRIKLMMSTAFKNLKMEQE
ncbi:2-hydroxyacyl-CoA dehydratase [Thomasclavelia sp.]|uniref:2-hydroxyacyl-CoA dehydratase n=1 Tax=Thomasclavelia sp. TaxID=3025757 RepID=UPI0025DD6C19|nr:2-hydroxyacyl-CoA dehydratase [Thomasclavelia sp.]